MEENILNILYEVDKTVCWDDCLDDIQDGMKNYQTAPDRGEDPENYLTPILPKYWEIFKAHNTYRKKNGDLPNQEYDIGVFLVGFSTVPITLSLAEIQPCQEIYFLYSEETTDMLNEISNRINSMLPNSPLSSLVACSVNDPNYALEIQGSSDPVQTFKRIKEVIEQVGNKRIALDLTGGKKTMLGGGFTAGSILAADDSGSLSGCDMYYVDSLKYDPRRRAPIFGTEFLTQLENPYDVYNLQSIHEAEILFDKHNYLAARNLWNRAKSTLKKNAKPYGLETEYKKIEKHYRMASCYRLWDAFYYKSAKDNKNSAHRDDIMWGYNDKHVNGSIDVLDILSDVNRESLFKKEKRIIHYAVDRYQNAERRRMSGKLDDAIVRFTQVVEMLCNYKIYQIAKNRNLVNHNNQVITSPGDKWRMTPLIKFLFEEGYTYYRGTYNDGSYTISDCTELLDVNKYGYGNATEIADLIDIRHNFVHFNNPMTRRETETDTKNLKNLARTFLCNFSEKYRCTTGLSLDELLELHRFRR